MGLDIIIVLVLIGLTLYGYVQGFIKGATSMLTPVLGLWLSIRYAKTLADLFSPRTSVPVLSIAFAVLAILVATYLGVRLIRYLAGKLFDKMKLWDMDRFLGGAFGLVRTVALVWIVLAFVFVAYPAGRKTIYSSRVATQILASGQGLPFLSQKMDQANNYITALSNPLKRYQLPSTPDSSDANAVSNFKALQGMNLMGD